MDKDSPNPFYALLRASRQCIEFMGLTWILKTKGFLTINITSKVFKRYLRDDINGKCIVYYLVFILFLLIAVPSKDIHIDYSASN